MFHQTKPLASLSSGLLARKGQARPAMRRQGLGDPAFTPPSIDDLGWNDMVGHVAEEPQSAPRVELTPEPASPPAAEPVEAIAVPHAAAPKRKAAFTLRLDPERHLRLRLASAVGQRSAQRLLVEALDDFLKTLPEVEDLAARVPSARAADV